MSEPRMSVKENEYLELSTSIKTIVDMTSRIDERVKILMQQQNDNNEKIEKVMDRVSDLMSRLAILESRNGTDARIKIDEVEKQFKEKIDELSKYNSSLNVKIAALEIHAGSNNSRWQFIADATFKVFIMVAAAFLALKLGLK